MTNDDVCGYDDTTTGHPCQWPHGRDSCPWHDIDGEPPTRSSLLEEEPPIKDLVAGELQNESTVPEACAAAGISVDQYHRWYGKGKDDDAKEIYREFRREARRARMIAAGTDRETVKTVAEKNADARTLWKAHMQQYGDIYAEEGDEPTADNVIEVYSQAPDKSELERLLKPDADD